MILKTPIKTILLIAMCSLFAFQASETTKTSETSQNLKRWAKQVWNQPDDWFIDSYEKAIFQRFQMKYPSPVIEHAESKGSKKLLELSLPGTKISYLLIFETNSQKKIQHVERFLPEISKLTDIPDAARWVGQFLYRIDAGDSAALMDLFFFRQVSVSYRQLGSKSSIAARLVKDFPGVFEMREFGIQSSEKKIRIQMDAQNLRGVTVELPEHLPAPQNTAEKQEKLYESLLATMSSRTIAPATTLQDWQRYYPDAKLSGTTLTVPYPTQKVQEIKSIRYLLNDNQITPQLRLTLADNASLKFNSSLALPYIGSNLDVEKALPTLNAALKELYSQIVNPSSSFTARGTLQYRGYDVRNLPLEKLASVPDFFHALRQEGSIYLYPTRIDVTKENSEIRGIIYVFGKQAGNSYHFLEWKLSLESESSSIKMIKLIFYPYIRSGEVIQFDEEL
ncbi:MAG: hypothetical protein ACRBF0_00420 [Calditrichia bacterium]